MPAVQIPAWCPRCGNFFPSMLAMLALDDDGREIPDPGGVSTKDNTETCPRCRGHARILDGEWAVRGDVLTLLRGPEWSHRALAAFYEQLTAARTVEQAWALAQRQAPEVAAAVEEVVDKRSAGDTMSTREQRLWMALQTLLCILSLAMGQSQNDGQPPLTPEQITYIVDRTMQSYEGAREAPEQPPSPAPEDIPPPPPGHELPPQT